jgi:hypothetical protein
MSFYRIQQANRNAVDLLNPANWESRQWFGEKLRDCGECQGAGCDACDFDGQIEDIRHGVSTCASIDTLIDYLRVVGCDLDDTVIVELAGTIADDEDHDTQFGAVLVHPTTILSITPVDDAFADAIYNEG